MTKKIIVALLLIVAVCAFTAQTIRPGSGPVWEYKFEYSGSEKKANELGSEGWELVAIQSTGPGIANNVPTYVFKRAKQPK